MSKHANKVSHTPGPWNTGLSGVFAPSTKERNVQVAEVWNEANARLIAAAPEMLEALKKAAFRLNKIKESGISDESLTLPILEAAIAKAEGEEL